MPSVGAAASKRKERVSYLENKITQIAGLSRTPNLLDCGSDARGTNTEYFLFKGVRISFDLLSTSDPPSLPKPRRVTKC